MQRPVMQRLVLAEFCLRPLRGLDLVDSVDLASEFVQLATAKYSFIANAKVIQAYSETEEPLLDIKT